MINLYTWSTPNGRKISIMLEEIDLPYQVHPVDLGANEQSAPSFLSISPNNKIPAIVDDSVIDPTTGAPLSIFESGAILTYLAETSGKLLATSGPAKFSALAWLHWQIGGLGPMLGQLGFFTRSAEVMPIAIERYTSEVDRLLGVLERRLSKSPFLAGEEYTIADISSFTWTLAATTMLKEPLAASLKSKPHLHQWLATIGERSAVVRGLQVLRK